MKAETLTEAPSRAEMNTLRMFRYYPGGLCRGWRAMPMPLLAERGYVALSSGTPAMWEITFAGRQALAEREGKEHG